MNNFIKVEASFNDANAIGLYPAETVVPSSVFVSMDTKKNETLKHMTADSLIRRILSMLFNEHKVQASDVIVVEHTNEGNKYGVVWIDSGYPGEFIWNSVSEERFKEVINLGAFER